MWPGTLTTGRYGVEILDPTALLTQKLVELENTCSVRRVCLKEIVGDTTAKSGQIKKTFSSVDGKLQTRH
jgi:hypothetical protein